MSEDDFLISLEKLCSTFEMIAGKTPHGGEQVKSVSNRDSVKRYTDEIVGKISTHPSLRHEVALQFVNLRDEISECVSETVAIRPTKETVYHADIIRYLINSTTKDISKKLTPGKMIVINSRDPTSGKFYKLEISEIFKLANRISSTCQDEKSSLKNSNELCILYLFKVFSSLTREYPKEMKDFEVVIDDMNQCLPAESDREAVTSALLTTKKLFENMGKSKGKRDFFNKIAQATREISNNPSDVDRLGDALMNVLDMGQVGDMSDAIATNVSQAMAGMKGVSADNIPEEFNFKDAIRGLRKAFPEPETSDVAQKDQP